MLLNEHVTVLPENSVTVKKRIREYLEKNSSATLLRLDQSLMNMPLPSVVKEGMCRAVEEVSDPFGVRLSSPWSGYESLKKAISAHLAQNSVQVPESDIFITSGLESAHACLSHLFAAENTVLLPDPCEAHLRGLHQCAGRNVTFVRFCPENGFAPEPDGEGADLIYLTSPSPVTGTALGYESLKKWVDFANENGSILFYDASLSPYLGEGYPKSIYEIEGARSCAIQIFSFEKGFGVKELKIAYVIIPSSLSRSTVRIREMFCARQPSTATPPSFVMQRAAELLLSKEAEEETEKLIYRIQKVAKTLSEGLTAAGIAHVGAETSPYLWAQCPDGLGSWQCFDKLLEETGCVVTPGSVFGLGGEGYFRITAFGMPDEAKLAVEKMTALFAKSEEKAGESEEEPPARLFSDSDEFS